MEKIEELWREVLEIIKRKKNLENQTRQKLFLV